MSVTHDITSVIRDHHTRVQRALRRFGVHERDLPDATQDVFIVVHRRLDTFEGRSKLSTWIHRIAFHVASEHRRRACNRREVLIEAELAPVASYDRDARERIAHVNRALDALDPEKREVWLDFELDEQPMATIAARLGIPLKTAFSRLYAARRELMRRMRESGLALVLPDGWLRRSAPSVTWITTLAAVVLVVPELHTVPFQESSTPVQRMVERANASAIHTSLNVPPPPQPQAATRKPAVLVTTSTRANTDNVPQRVRPSWRRTSSGGTSAAPSPPPIAPSAIDDLIVFRDSDITLTPRVMPPMQAELPAAPAREPRTQLRGSKPVRWQRSAVR